MPFMQAPPAEVILLLVTLGGCRAGNAHKVELLIASQKVCFVTNEEPCMKQIN